MDIGPSIGVNPGQQPTGLVLLCDISGNVTQVIRDDLGIGRRFQLGHPFTLGVERASLSKALSFAVDLKAEGAAFDWEINVPVSDDVITLHFAGVIVDDQLLIVAARSSDGVLQLCEDMAKVNSEQANVLRAALKEHAETTHAQAKNDKALYDELSRLNNEMANLQRELAKRNAELARLDRLKNQFLGVAAHDLRTPLGIILGYSEFLLDEADDALNDEHYRFLDIIQSSSRFMLQLVDDLLDISTIESGHLELHPSPTDLVALVRRNVALNSVLAEKKRITLTYRQTEHIPSLSCDGPKIEQVLNNLLSNAVKYSYPDSKAEISLSRTDTEAIIAVHDHGQGIPADQLDSLFQWFGRTRTRGTAGEKSTGLGLAIAHKIVLEHGGRMWVESEAGKGSTFYVALPLGGKEKPR
jgi:signal transduction histidine kinase